VPGVTLLLRRSGRVVLLAAALLLASGCGEILVDYQTGATTSSATVEVVPTTVTVGGAAVDAIDVQVRYCDAIKWTNLPADAPPGYPTRFALNQRAVVKDSTGTTIFSDYGYEGEPQPQGWYQTSDADPSLLDHIVVPVGGVSTPLTIAVGCTSHTAGTAPAVTWSFAPCTTADRTCPLSRDGTYTYFPGA